MAEVCPCVRAHLLFLTEPDPIADFEAAVTEIRVEDVVASRHCLFEQILLRRRSDAAEAGLCDFEEPAKESACP